MPVLLFRLSVAVAIAAAVWIWSGGFGGTVDAPLSTAEASEPVSWRESDLWLAPDADPVAPSELAQGAAWLAAGAPADALPLVSKALADPALAPYARLYVGQSLLSLEDHERALEAAAHIIDASPGGHLEEAAWWLRAEALENAEAWGEAIPVWKRLAARSSPMVPAVLLRLATAAEKAGNLTEARAAYEQLYYERPTSAEAAQAETWLMRMPDAIGRSDTFQRERTRAEALYAARRFADARRAFERLQPRATGDARASIDLRLAQCDVELRRFDRGLEALQAYSTRHRNDASRVDAEFAMLTALRGSKRSDYPSSVSRFVRDHPDSPLAERALNELATHYILANDDARAAQVFTDMYARYPTGAYADRAAWRAGWWAYRAGNLRETIRLFESASTSMRRADYRPSWLYWTARAHARLKNHEAARRWYLRTIADYRNSYYGREAARQLDALPGAGWTPADVAAERDPSRAIVAGERPANAALVERLLEASLWDAAIGELRHLQAESGTTPAIEATIAYALNRKGELRPAITAMRRAYPQFMSDGGEELPGRILRVIFPVAYDDLLQRYADERRIDRHLLTALVAQESTFQADVRSSADAWGLMQLLPSTGRRYATRIGLRGFGQASLIHPETNVRLGTAYLSDLLARFGDVAPALAAYNAGENRVTRWLSERPGLPRDEFIDDIPFPETQNYVKRIIGTAEDYRLLYGTGVIALMEVGR